MSDADDPIPELTPREQETLAFLELALRPDDDAARRERIKKRLVLRRRPRWLVRGAVGSAIAASLALVFFLLPSSPKLPPAEVLQAAQSGDPAAVDLAMQAYRRDLVHGPVLADHARADAAIAAGDFAAARTTLTSLTHERGIVGRDAWFRLATLELRAGRSDAAIANADSGLSLGKPADVFTVNLYLARAAAHRSRGEEDAATDDLQAAVVLIEAIVDATLKPR